MPWELSDYRTKFRLACGRKIIYIPQKAPGGTDVLNPPSPGLGIHDDCCECQCPCSTECQDLTGDGWLTFFGGEEGPLGDPWSSTGWEIDGIGHAIIDTLPGSGSAEIITGAGSGEIVLWMNGFFDESVVGGAEQNVTMSIEGKVNGDEFSAFFQVAAGVGGIVYSVSVSVVGGTAYSKSGNWKKYPTYNMRLRLSDESSDDEDVTSISICAMESGERVIDNKGAKLATPGSSLSYTDIKFGMGGTVGTTTVDNVYVNEYGYCFKFEPPVECGLCTTGHTPPVNLYVKVDPVMTIPDGTGAGYVCDCSEPFNRMYFGPLTQSVNPCIWIYTEYFCDDTGHVCDDCGNDSQEVHFSVTAQVENAAEPWFSAWKITFNVFRPGPSDPTCDCFTSVSYLLAWDTRLIECDDFPFTLDLQPVGAWRQYCLLGDPVTGLAESVELSGDPPPANLLNLANWIPPTSKGLIDLKDYPGTAVASLFTKYKCDGRSYVHTMNNNGLQWCLDNVDLICSWIKRTAKLKKTTFDSEEVRKELIKILEKLKQ